MDNGQNGKSNLKAIRTCLEFLMCVETDDLVDFSGCLFNASLCFNSQTSKHLLIVDAWHEANTQKKINFPHTNL